jgi:hypothetical protein
VSCIIGIVFDFTTGVVEGERERELVRERESVRENIKT